MSESSTGSSNGPFNLSQLPVHLGATDSQVQGAVPVTGFVFDPASFEKFVGEYCPDGSGRLLMVEHSPADWGYWECHPEGDEVVLVLSGSAEFIQEIDGAQERIAVQQGEAVINPAGVWHTADVSEPLTALYMTPCANTQHRLR